MKKFLTLILTALLAFSLTACEDDKDEPQEVDTNLYTKYTDELKMDFTYEGKEFIADGIGEVTLTRCTDGDTAQFKSGSNTFAVRFLGIDTPESTYRLDPWGKAASSYTCEKLTNAETIVLESEGERTDGNDRYLAWVWYDGKLLNLELVEQAYSGAKGLGGSKYEDLFYQVESEVQNTDRRIWGEKDPDFDYSLDGVQITIEELVNNIDEYIGMKIVLTGFVAAKGGKNPYIVDENGYGIYLYLGYDNSVKFEIGNEVRVSGLNLSFYPDKDTGSPQLVGFMKTNVDLLSEGNTITPREIDVKDFEVSDLGSYIKVSNVTVTQIFESSNTGDFTVTVVDGLGNEMGLHISSAVGRALIDSKLAVGTTIDVTGPLSRYMGQYQLELNDLETVVQK
jgi:micrococcal nuclease